MRCPSCDTPNAPEARFCSHCGGKLPQAAGAPEIEVVEEVGHPPRRPDVEYERRPRPAPLEYDQDADEPGGMATIIPYRNGKALASYYLGMLCLLVLAALAAVMIVALVQQVRWLLAFN